MNKTQAMTKQTPKFCTYTGIINVNLPLSEANLARVACENISYYLMW